jgi:hypothetical protein
MLPSPPPHKVHRPTPLTSLRFRAGLARKTEQFPDGRFPYGDTPVESLVWKGPGGVPWEGTGWRMRESIQGRLPVRDIESGDLRSGGIHYAVRGSGEFAGTGVNWQKVIRPARGNYLFNLPPLISLHERAGRERGNHTSDT